MATTNLALLAERDRLPAGEADALHEIASTIRDAANRQRVAVLEIGRQLLRAKEILPHGQFLPWVEAEFAWSDRTAQSYMLVAENLGEKYETVSVLPSATIYQLAAKSTPEAVRIDVVETIQSGRTLSPFDVRKRIAEAKRAEGAAAERARLSPEERKKVDRKLEIKKAREERQRQVWRDERDAEARTREDAAHAAADLVRPLLGERIEEFADLVETLKGGTGRFLDCSAAGRQSTAEAAQAGCHCRLTRRKGVNCGSERITLEKPDTLYASGEGRGALIDPLTKGGGGHRF